MIIYLYKRFITLLYICNWEISKLCNVEVIISHGYLMLICLESFKYIIFKDKEIDIPQKQLNFLTR